MDDTTGLETALGSTGSFEIGGTLGTPDTIGAANAVPPQNEEITSSATSAEHAPPSFEGDVDRTNGPALEETAIEFRVTRPGAPNRRLRLTGNRYTFGNAEGCSIRLSDLALRPMHAVLIRDEARILVRAYSVPILINGQRKTESAIHPGDVLQLGDYRFELLTSDVPSTSQTLNPELNPSPRSIFEDTNRPFESSRDSSSAVPAADDLMWRERLRREIDQWRDRQADCDRRENRCDEREADLRSRESELWTRAEGLYRREARLQSQEQAAFQLYDEFTQRQQELLRLREEAQSRQESFNRREAEFRNLEFEYRHRLEDATRQLHQAEQQAETATQAVQRMRAQFESLNRQIEELSEQQRDIDQREQQQRDEHERLRSELEQARDAAVDQHHASEQQRREAEERAESLANQLASLREGEDADLKSHREQLEQSEQLVQQLRDQVEQLQQSVQEASDKSQGYRADYEQACQSVQQLESLVAQTAERGDEERESWIAEADDLRTTIEKLSIELAQANGELSDLREANERLTSRLDDMQAERDLVREELGSRPETEQFESLQSELESANGQLSELRDEYQKTLDDLEQSQQEREQLKQEQASLLEAAAESKAALETDGTADEDVNLQDAVSDDAAAQPADAIWGEPAVPSNDESSVEATSVWDQAISESNIESRNEEKSSSEPSLGWGDTDLSDTDLSDTDLSDTDQGDSQSGTADGPSAETDDRREQTNGEFPASETSEPVWGSSTPVEEEASEQHDIPVQEPEDLAPSVWPDSDAPALAAADSASDPTSDTSSSNVEETRDESNLWPDTDTTEPLALNNDWDAEEALANEPVSITDQVENESQEPSDEVEATYAWQDPAPLPNVDESNDDLATDNFAESAEGIGSNEESDTQSTAMWSPPAESMIEASNETPLDSDIPVNSETPVDTDESDAWNQPSNDSAVGSWEPESPIQDVSSSDEPSHGYGLDSANVDPETYEPHDAENTDESVVDGSLASMLIKDFENENRSLPADDSESNIGTDEPGSTQQWDNAEQNWDQEHSEELYASEWSNDPEGYRVEEINQRSPLDEAVESTQAWQETPEGIDELTDSEANTPSDESAFGTGAESTFDDSSHIDAQQDHPVDDVQESSSETEPQSEINEPLDQVSANDAGEDDEDSIEAYMNRLLQRVQTPGSDSEPTTASITGNNSQASFELSESPTDDSLEMEEQEEIDPSAPLVPRSQAPEKTADLSALRALANQTARSAITRSDRVQSRDIQLKGMVSFACAGGAIFCGVACYFFLPGVIRFVAVAMTLIVAAVYGREGIQLFQQANSRIKVDESETESGSEAVVAEEESDEPVQIGE